MRRHRELVQRLRSCVLLRSLLTLLFFLRSLLTRPLGVTTVTNPIAASGGADPETVAEIRDNAPLTVLTMDRIVSLSDFEDFAQTFNGIGQARAALLWTGESQLVHLTLADSDGDPVIYGSALYESLLTALDLRRNQLQRVELAPFEPSFFNVDATIIINAVYDAETVAEAVRSALVASFSFVNRHFGQTVTASEVISIIQNTEGVIAVDLNELYYSDAEASRQVQLPALTARWTEGAAEAAQLLLINPDEESVVLTIEY